MEVREVSLKDKNVHELIDKLDQYQIGLYGLKHCYLDSISELVESNAYMVGGYFNKSLVGIGAVKIFNDYAEIKRMFFSEDHRGSGLASKLLTKLEIYVIKNSICKVFLETGYLQETAVAFYKKHGYSEIGSFGDYTSNGVSVFLGKNLVAKDS